MTIFMGFQHICFFAISLSFPVIIVRGIGGTTEQAEFMVSMSMIAAGIGAIIMAFPKGPVGSGYLCPPVCSPTNLAAAMIASQTGGLSLLYGMTFISGVFEVLFGKIVNRLRMLFPPEVTGIIVAMVGITVIKIACKSFLGLSDTDQIIQPVEVIVGASTLVLIVGLNIWSKGKLKLFSVLIGMLFGYILSFAVGLLGSDSFASVRDASLFWFPFTRHPGWSFSLSLIVPYLIVMICSAVKTIGDVTTCQKINDSRWTRPDMKNISKGVMTDGLSDVAAGILGGSGQSTSSSNVGLSIATGVTSRVVAYALGGLLIAIAFIPKVASIFAIMPEPVMGATLIFAISFMIVSGLQIIVSRMIDARRTMVIGISLIFGLMVDIMPDTFANMHPWIHPVFSSSLATAAITAIVLNLIFRIGIKKTQIIELEPETASLDKFYIFMDKAGASWGARKEIIIRATYIANEFLETAAKLGLARGKIKFAASFDEYNLDVNIAYNGDMIELPQDRPSNYELANDESSYIRLSGYLIIKQADKVKSSCKDGECQLLFHFEH